MLYNILCACVYAHILSTSLARSQALVALFIFTLYHTGVATLSMISTVVPSCMVTTLSSVVFAARGADESLVLGDMTTADSCDEAAEAASEARTIV